MFGNTVDLGIRVTSDITGGVSGLRSTEGALNKVKGVALGVAAAVGAVAVAAGAYAVSAIGSAGDLEQSIGAIDTVFKDSAGQMHTWAQSAAQDVGLTRNEFNELGTLIGTQLKNGGTAMEDLGGKTNELIGLGADLSSMFGGTSKEAVEALSSALKGERDPIERYGVSLKQASIDAKAAELGFTKVGGALSDEANQAATLALIMEQTADAHGNFAKESDTLQGKQQRFAAQMENTKAIIGTALLPAATALFGYFNDVAGPALENLATKFSTFVSALDFSEVTGGFRAFVAAFKAGDGDITSAGFPGFMEHAANVARTAFDTISVGVQTVVGWFNDNLKPALDGLAQAFTDRFLAVQGIVSEFAAGLWTHIEPLIPMFQDTFATIGEIVVLAVELVTEAWDAGTAAILAAWEIVGPPIIDVVGTIFRAVMNVISPAIDTIKSILKTALAAIRGDWSGAWEGVKGIVDGVWRTIKALIGGAIDVVKSVISNALGIIKDLWSRGWNSVKDLLSNAWDGIKSAVSSGVDGVVTYFRELPGRIIDAISNLGSRLNNVGRNIIQGLINGVKAMAGKVVDSVRGVIDGAIAGAKKLLGIASPSKLFRQLGINTGEGFVAGLRGQEVAVTRAGRSLVGASVPNSLPTLAVRPGARSGPGSAGGGDTYEINLRVDGALDKDATARQIVDILDGYFQRRGLVPLGGKVLGGVRA